MSRLPETLTLNGIPLHKHKLQPIHDYLAASNDPLQIQVLEFLLEWFDEDDQIVLRTSGSTGKPKEIRVHKQKIVNSAQMTIDFFGLTAKSQLLLCLSPTFVAGKMMIARAMLAGANLITASVEANPVKKLEQAIDFTAMVPLQLDSILKKTPEKLDLIRTIIIGGSAIPPHLEEQLQCIHTQCWHTYGMTETLSHIALRPVNGSKATSWFSPMHNITLKDDDRGCLCILAPSLHEKEIVTNDMVVWNNNRFKVQGRIDDVILSAGHKIHPAELEHKIAAIIDPPFAISSYEDREKGQIPVLVVTVDYSIVSSFQLWNSLENLLTLNEMPRLLLSLSTLPMLESGKIDRQQLKQLVEAKIKA